jgi:hypothetical protein
MKKKSPSQDFVKYLRKKGKRRKLKAVWTMETAEYLAEAFGMSEFQDALDKELRNYRREHQC